MPTLPTLLLCSSFVFAACVDRDDGSANEQTAEAALDSTDSANADMVVEGQDQYRGWLQSLLWTAAGAREPHTPYASVIVHGFVVDGDNRKMSKSLGNVVDPMHVLEGSAKQKMPVCGIDALR